MKIAVTYQNGNIFQHFGHTEQFKLYEVENNTIINTQIVNTNGSGHGALASFLAANAVDTLICGGIGAGAQNALAMAGIKLYGGVSGSADKAVEALNAIPMIPCTACRYCVDDCPQKINIPEIFKAVNAYKQFGNAAGTNKPFNQWNYTRATKDGGKASDCIQCGSCEAHCPQHINIIEELKAAATIYEA